MEKLEFHHLAPTSKANIDYYKEALDYVFEHPEIKNIAIPIVFSVIFAVARMLIWMWSKTGISMKAKPWDC